MALLGKSFVTEEAEDMSFELLPIDCDYTAQIEKSEIKTTAAGNGEYIKNQWKILDAPNPAHIGRTVFQNINIQNPSEVAMKIGASDLKQITKALGISELQDTDELVGVPVIIKLKVQKGKDGYEDSNQIKKVTPIDGESEGSEGQPWLSK